MKCLICGREYVALGVHLRHKHKVSPDDYRDEFGMLRTAPLVDDDLSEHLSAAAKRRLLDDEYRDEVSERCRKNADANKGKPAPGMSQAGKQKLAQRNASNNAAYLIDRSKVTAPTLADKVTLLDVRKAHGGSHGAAKRSAALAGVVYSLEAAKKVRAERAAATAKAKMLRRIAHFMQYHGSSESAAEACRRAGVPKTTYKNWLAAGLVPRHHNGIGPRLKDNHAA